MFLQVVVIFHCSYPLTGGNCKVSWGTRGWGLRCKMEFKVDCLLPQGGHHHLGQEQLRLQR